MILGYDACVCTCVCVCVGGQIDKLTDRQTDRLRREEKIVTTRRMRI